MRKQAILAMTVGVLSCAAGLLAAPGDEERALRRPDEALVCPASSAAVADLIEDHTGSFVGNAKNRFISFTAGDAGRSQAIRVTLSDLPAPYDVWNDVAMWVGEPFEYSESVARGFSRPCTPADPCSGPTFMSAELDCGNPSSHIHFRDWSGVGTIHVRHEAIVPGASYCIQVVEQGFDCPLDDEANYSAPTIVNTGRWGDLVGLCLNGVWTAADGDLGLATDVTAMLGTTAGGLAKTTRMDLVGVGMGSSPDLDGIITVSDTIALLGAIEGYAPYPFAPSVSDPCPGSPHGPGAACNMGGGICGDGIPDFGEECDDGNSSNGDGCDQFCRLEFVCGNGILEYDEECDDTNVISGDGCDRDCRVEGDAVISLIPTGSSGDSTINGNEITLASGGQTVVLEVFLENWDPDQNGDPRLGGWQVQIDSSGYTSGVTGQLSPAGVLTPAAAACTEDRDCRVAFGGVCTETGASCLDDSDCPIFPIELCQGSTCSYPIAVGGFCEPGFIFDGHSDLLTGTSNFVDLSTPEFRYEGHASGLVDSGQPQYLGTLVLDVPVGAGGTYTVGVATGVTQTHLPATNCSLIPYGSLQSALITMLQRPKFSQRSDCPCDGDVNGDGQVTIPFDVVPIASCLCGGDCSQCANSACDVDCDGSVDAVDLEMALRLYQGLPVDNLCRKHEGESIASNIDLVDESPNVVVADDFVSDGRPITGVRWWGSRLESEAPSCHCDTDTEGGEFCHAAISDPPGCLLVTPCSSSGQCLGGQRCDPDNQCQPGGGCVLECPDTTCATAVTCKLSADPPEGWLISFHEPLTALGSAAPPLGLYFCLNDVVETIDTTIPACDALPVNEYEVSLADCCLVTANADSRGGAVPALSGLFAEERCLDYAMSIQATTGLLYVDDGTGMCVELPIGSPRNDKFWGWYTTDAEIGAAYGLQPALSTSVTSVGTDWLFGPWSPVAATCSQPNMAFELLTPERTLDPPLCEPNRVEKNRYISMVPTNPGIETALRVTLVSSVLFPSAEGLSWWVGPPEEQCENSGQTTPPPGGCGPTGGVPLKYKVAKLQCEQECRDWSEEGLMHVFGEHVVPEAFYRVDAVECVCDADVPVGFSTHIAIPTSEYCDVCGAVNQPCDSGPDDRVDYASDLLAVMAKFTNQPGSLPTAQTDLLGNIDNVDNLINVVDYLQVTLTFEGAPFQFAGPQACPPN